MKTKILLVENDIPVHAALNGVLRREGYDVINAFDTDEAMVCLQTHPGIDLVLLGLCVPVESGWRILERLHWSRPLLPVIILTALPDQEAAAQAAGVGALLEKPLDIPVLLQTMRKLLAEPLEDGLARIAGQPPLRHQPIGLC